MGGREHWRRAALSGAVAACAALSATCASILGVDGVEYVSDAGGSPESANASDAPGADAAQQDGDAGATADGACSPSAPSGHLFAIGGSDIASSNGTSTVFVAPVFCDGSLGAWATTASLPHPIFRHAGAALGDVVVVTAGFDDQPVSVSGATFQASVAAGGGIDRWLAVTQTQALWRRGYAAAGGRLYLVGGAMGDPAMTVNQVELGVVEAGEVKFQGTTSMTVTLARNTLIAAGSFLYSLGGVGGDGGDGRDVWIARIDEASGALGQWAPGPRLVEQIADAPGVAMGGFLFALGGAFQQAGTSVARSRVTADGGLEPWIKDDQGLPAPRVSHAAIAFQNRIYLVGGIDDKAAATKAVFVGTQNGPSIEWRSGPELPAPRAHLVLAGVASH